MANNLPPWEACRMYRTGTLTQGDFVVVDAKVWAEVQQQLLDALAKIAELEQKIKVQP